MAEGKAIYKSYLLRVWRDEANGRTRIHLEQIGREANVLHFADIESFIGYLLSTPPLHTKNVDAEFESKGDQAYESEC